MEPILIICCLLALLMSGLCFFGQLFVGHFLPTATAMGIFGLIAAFSGISVSAGSHKYRRVAAVGGFGGVLAVAADVANYYLHLAIPGNYYAWFIFGPYAIVLAIIGTTAIRGAEKSKGCENSLQRESSQGRVDKSAK